MSPVSRGRRKKHATGRPRHLQAAPSLQSVHMAQVRAFRPLLGEEDPLAAESVAAGMQGTWWKALPPDEDPDATFGQGAIEYAASQSSREALAFLRAFAVLGVTEEQRWAAANAADRLAAAGIAEPRWAATIGRVSVGECWQFGDVFGDQASLLCRFGYGDHVHGLVALLDFNHLGGWAKDLFVTDEPDRVLAEFRKQAAAESLTRLDAVAPATARRLLEDALAATDATWEPEVAQDFRDNRALALARCRAMPPPVEPAQPAPEIDEEDRHRIVTAFVSSLDASAFSGDPDSAAYCAGLVVDHGADYDVGRPLRVSPAKTETFLHSWLPAKAMLDADDIAAMPAVISAWVRWAGPQSGLSDAAVAVVAEVADECGGHFAEAYAEGVEGSPIRQLLDGLDPSNGLPDLEAAVERRMFAMPFFGTRIGDEDHPSLNPGDPDERRLLIEGEHPEYLEALADPGFAGEIDGVNPGLHIAFHEIVANQLWNDDPPEAWRAARRMLDAGLDRHDVLHALAEVAATRLHGALSTHEPVDLDEYRKALDALPTDEWTALRTAEPPAEPPAKPAGRSAGRRGGSTARTARAATTYQVKVSLLGARPPIWRRLRLPGATTLAALHQVIQSAFGWNDSHLHLFEAGGRRYAPRAFELEGCADERRVRLDAVAPGTGDRIRYTYDLGDSWEHEILVEDISAADAAVSAVCVAGRRAGPPDDCGGVWGYAELCEILADPAHPEHEERLDWLGYRHDPDALDRDDVNQRLAGIRLA